MDDLRDKIAEIICGTQSDHGAAFLTSEWSRVAADRIMQIFEAVLDDELEAQRHSTILDIETRQQ